MDEVLPESMPEHDLRHVTALGWKGTKNGMLLKMTEEAGFGAMITADKNMPYQQSLKGRTFFLIVLDIHPNTIVTQTACVPAIRALLRTSKAGEVAVVEGPHPKRDRA